MHIEHKPILNEYYNICFGRKSINLHKHCKRKCGKGWSLSVTSLPRCTFTLSSSFSASLHKPVRKNPHVLIYTHPKTKKEKVVCESFLCVSVKPGYH